MNSSILRKIVLVLSVLAVAVIAVSCHPGPYVVARPPGEAPPVIQPLDLPSCPDHESFPPVKDGALPDTILPLSGAITKVPEFHDCQRLIDPHNPREYGPLAGIWVAQDLTDRSYELDRIPVGRGLAMALVYTWYQPFEPLHMAAGWNCLYFVSAATPSHLQAFMVPVGDANDCTNSTTLAGIVERLRLTPLFVSKKTYPGLGRGDYPPVGRWDWLKFPYIGLGCGNAWCEVSAESANLPPAPYSVSSGSRREEQRVFRVKGWYDEQTLAAPPPPGATAPASGLNLIPAGPIGVVVPDPGLDAITDTITFVGQWVPVAQVSIDKRDEVYRAKLNLHQASMPTGGTPVGLTQVFMCRDGTTKCKGATSECTDGWHARIVGGGTTTYPCVTRTDHSDLMRDYHIHIPGTARWQWENGDEKLWTGCAEGCCKVH